jgi:hypothetical protein
MVNSKLAAKLRQNPVATGSEEEILTAIKNVEDFHKSGYFYNKFKDANKKAAVQSVTNNEINNQMQQGGKILNYGSILSFEKGLPSFVTNALNNINNSKIYSIDTSRKNQDNFELNKEKEIKGVLKEEPIIKSLLKDDIKEIQLNDKIEYDDTNFNLINLDDLKNKIDEENVINRFLDEDEIELQLNDNLFYDKNYINLDLNKLNLVPNKNKRNKLENLVTKEESKNENEENPLLLKKTIIKFKKPQVNHSIIKSGEISMATKDDKRNKSREDWLMSQGLKEWELKELDDDPTNFKGLTKDGLKSRVQTIVNNRKKYPVSYNYIIKNNLLKPYAQIDYTKNVSPSVYVLNPNEQFKQGGKILDQNGYLLSNFLNFTPKKVIQGDANGTTITTNGMAFPILANGKKLFPNTGEYRFKESFVEEVPMYQVGGETFEDWYKTVPVEKNDTSSYNLRRAYELAPKKQLNEFVNNPKSHLYTAYENPQTGIYEFMKSKNHPTLNEELKWYNSNDKEAINFRKNYKLDTSGDYYKYVPMYRVGGGVKNNKIKADYNRYEKYLDSNYVYETMTPKAIEFKKNILNEHGKSNYSNKLNTNINSDKNSISSRIVKLKPESNLNQQYTKRNISPIYYEELSISAPKHKLRNPFSDKPLYESKEKVNYTYYIPYYQKPQEVEYDYKMDESYKNLFRGFANNSKFKKQKPLNLKVNNSPQQLNPLSIINTREIPEQDSLKVTEPIDYNQNKLNLTKSLP